MDIFNITKVNFNCAQAQSHSVSLLKQGGIFSLRRIPQCKKQNKENEKQNKIKQENQNQGSYNPRDRYPLAYLEFVQAYILHK